MTCVESRVYSELTVNSNPLPSLHEYTSYDGC